MNTNYNVKHSFTVIKSTLKPLNDRRLLMGKCSNRIACIVIFCRLRFRSLQSGTVLRTCGWRLRDPPVMSFNIVFQPPITDSEDGPKF